MLLLVLSLAAWTLPGGSCLQDGDIGYMIARGRSVKGKDLTCKQLTPQGKLASYCRECGGLASIAAKCAKISECAGFDMENYDCGYLKTKYVISDLQEQAGYTSFCKMRFSSTNSKSYQHCSGIYNMWPDNTSPPGMDFDCNYLEEGVRKKFCKHEGNHLNLMDECDQNRYCEVFVIEAANNGKFGLLKRRPANADTIHGSTAVRSEGSLYFVKNDGNPSIKQVIRPG